jgi:hypothetical protein
MENWDPQPNERQYYRSAETGDLGWLVRRDGKDRVRLDRAMQEITLPFTPDRWIEEREWKPFSRLSIDRLLFEADKQLCHLLGLHMEAKRDWLSLSEEKRIEWMKTGPGPGGLRAELYLAVEGVLRKHSR